MLSIGDKTVEFTAKITQLKIDFPKDYKENR
jgi:hypothetical protein